MINQNDKVALYNLTGHRIDTELISKLEMVPCSIHTNRRYDKPDLKPDSQHVLRNRCNRSKLFFIDQ